MHSLADVLMFWAEVSIGAPLLEGLRSIRDRRWGNDGGEYVHLAICGGWMIGLAWRMFLMMQLLVR
jgi:hypothetical protein